jgi:multiple sugar transport system substrate-binding protein
MREETGKLTRRDFLRLGALAAGGTVLSAACGAPTAVAPTAEAPMATEPVVQQPTAPEQVTLRWQDWSDWEPDLETFMNLAAEHLPNIKIEFEPLQDDVLAEKTLTMMIAGTAPDVMTAWGPILRMWDEKGQLLDLQPYVDRDYSQTMQENFHPGLWNGMFNPATGVRFAIPYYFNLVMLLYNKDAFDEAGVPYPTKDMDHTDYAEMLSKMTKKEGDKTVRWGGSVPAWSYDRSQLHIQAFGGHFVNPDDLTECMLDRPEAQEALEWMRARIWDDNTTIQRLQVEDTSEYGLWPTGLVATLEGGMGALSFYANDTPFKWAMTHMPKGTARRATMGEGDGWNIWKGTKYPDQAWEFIKFLAGDDNQNLMIELWGSIPNRRSLIPSWRDVTLQGLPMLADANLDAVVEALDEGYSMPIELFKKQSESDPIINAALEKVFVVGDTPVSYFKEVAQQLTDLNRAS